MASGEDEREDLVRVSGSSACQHTDLEYLGGDRGGNEYYRCLECDGAFIQSGSVTAAEIRAELDDGPRTSGPNPFADLMGPAADRQGPPVTENRSDGTNSPKTPLDPSLAAALWAAVRDRLPLGSDEDREA